MNTPNKLRMVAQRLTFIGDDKRGEALYVDNSGKYFSATFRWNDGDTEFGDENLRW